MISILHIQDLMRMLIDQELIMIYGLEKQVATGERTKEDVEKNTIMFNLHKDRNLLPIIEARKLTQFKKLREAEEGENGPNPGRQTVSYAQTGGEQERSDMKKVHQKLLNAFIGGLGIPTYNSMKHYYYYDVLEALVRNLLQNIIKERKKKLDEQDLEKEDDSESEGADIFKTQTSSKNCPIDDGSHDAAAMEEKHIREGNIETILRNLEKIGPEKNVHLFKEMKQLRTKRNKAVAHKLTYFGCKHEIIDSSQVMGATTIRQYLQGKHGAIERARARLRDQQEHGDGQGGGRGGGGGGAQSPHSGSEDGSGDDDGYGGDSGVDRSPSPAGSGSEEAEYSGSEQRGNRRAGGRQDLRKRKAKRSTQDKHTDDKSKTDADKRGTKSAMTRPQYDYSSLAPQEPVSAPAQRAAARPQAQQQTSGTSTQQVRQGQTNQLAQNATQIQQSRSQARQLNQQPPHRVDSRPGNKQGDESSAQVEESKEDQRNQIHDFSSLAQMPQAQQVEQANNTIIEQDQMESSMEPSGSSARVLQGAMGTSGEVNQTDQTNQDELGSVMTNGSNFEQNLKVIEERSINFERNITRMEQQLNRIAQVMNEPVEEDSGQQDDEESNR